MTLDRLITELVAQLLAQVLEALFGAQGIFGGGFIDTITSLLGGIV